MQFYEKEIRKSASVFIPKWTFQAIDFLAKGVLLVTLVYGEPENAHALLNRSEDPIWCSVKLESDGQVTTARPGNKSWSESLAFLVYNIDTEHVSVYLHMPDNYQHGVKENHSSCKIYCLMAKKLNEII